MKRTRRLAWRDLPEAAQTAAHTADRYSDTPVQVMYEWLDLDGVVTMSTVYGWVRKCRRDGWLTPATPGIPGAEPTPKLIEWCQTQGIDIAEYLGQRKEQP